MKFSFKKARTFSFLCGIAFLTTACVSRYAEGDVFRTTDYSVGPYTITEEVQYDYRDFVGDYYYQRVYVVEQQTEEVATFRGETTMWGVELKLAGNPPVIVDDWLAVFSLGQVWIWQPGKEAITFDPVVSLESDVWRDNGLEKPMDAHSYMAKGFQIKEGKWILEYYDAETSSPLSENGSTKLKHYYFVSEDQGQTFVPAEDFSAGSIFGDGSKSGPGSKMPDLE